MPKSLGQIHTVNYELQGTTHGDRFLLDCPGQLTEQLGHMVRTMSNFKLVGVDMTLTDYAASEGGQSLTGVLKYYAPTRGRVLAIREAYKAVRGAMKIKGIKPGSNENYDFRPPLEPMVVFENGADYLNAASIQFDYTTNAFVELAIDNNPTRNVVFDMWNAQLQPRQGLSGAPAFSTGYDVTLGGVFRPLGSSPTGSISPDFVLNEGMYLNAPKNYASTQYEEIPFTVANSDGTSAILQFMWRPDPALYVSVLMGQFSLDVVEFLDEHGGNFYQLDVALHIAGWKSIASDHKKKRRSKKGKSHGRKRSKK